MLFDAAEMVMKLVDRGAVNLFANGKNSTTSLSLLYIVLIEVVLCFVVLFSTHRRYARVDWKNTYYICIYTSIIICSCGSIEEEFRLCFQGTIRYLLLRRRDRRSLTRLLAS